MTLDQRLVNKDKSEPRDGLAQQGKVHVGLAQHYANDLADSGWSAADTVSLAANVVSLEQTAGSSTKTSSCAPARRAQTKKVAEVPAPTGPAPLDGSQPPA